MWRLTRRRLGGAVVAAAGLSGCLGAGSGTLSLQTTGRGLSETFLLAGADRSARITRHAAALNERLLETGRVETLERSLDGRISHPDTTAPAAVADPRFLAADGYYRLSVTESTATTVDDWVVWFEPVADAPADARRVDDWRSELGGFDRVVLGRAGLIATNALGDETQTDRPLGERGYPLLDPLSSDDTTLVPDPPFTHALLERNVPGEPNEQPVRLHVERGPVETTRYTTTAERVADDRDDFESYLDANLLDATLAPGRLPEAQREIVETAHDDGYREEDGPSDALRRLLERFGIETFQHDDRFVEPLTYEYDGGYYRTTYRIQ